VTVGKQSKSEKGGNQEKDPRKKGIGFNDKKKKDSGKNAT